MTTLTVSEIARASGVAASAIRFYERHGLVRGERTAGNQRRFRVPDVCRIKVIRVAQRVGLTVAEIKAFLDGLPTEHEPTTDDWRRLTEQLIAEATARVRELTAVLTDIAHADKLCDLPPATRPAPRLHSLRKEPV